MDPSSPEPEKKNKKYKKIRCNHPLCKKNISLMPFNCKCGKSFCIVHKNPELHECSFDYKCISDLEKKDLIDRKCYFEKIKLI